MTTNVGTEYRIAKIEGINSQIFDLVYYGKFTFSDCERMTSVELKWFHSKLVKVKSDENKAREDALKKINNTAQSINNSTRPRVNRTKIRRR